MVTAVFGSGSLSVVRLKKTLPSSGMSGKSIPRSLSVSILAHFVRDRFLVVCFFTCVCLLCRDNANRVWLPFGKSDYHEPPANESEADLPGLAVVFPALSGPTNIRLPNISRTSRKSRPCLAMFALRLASSHSNRTGEVYIPNVCTPRLESFGWSDDGEWGGVRPSQHRR